MAEEDLGTAYGGQQEDINDKLLLDLAWERQQKKVSHSAMDIKVLRSHFLSCLAVYERA